LAKAKGADKKKGGGPDIGKEKKKHDERSRPRGRLVTLKNSGLRNWRRGKNALREEIQRGGKSRVRSHARLKPPNER